VDHKILTAHREQVNNCFLLLLTSAKHHADILQDRSSARRANSSRVKLPRLLWGLGG